MEKPLAAEFSVRSIEEMDRFGRMLGGLSMVLYNSEHNLQTEPESNQKVMYICLEGPPESGKSTLADCIAVKNVGGENSGFAVDGTNLFDGDVLVRSIVAWKSYWSEFTGQQNTFRDCFLTKPYKCNDEVSEIPRPARTKPGLEILEHPYTVPEKIKSLMISIEGVEDEPRTVRVSIENATEACEKIWAEFIEHSQSQGLAFTELAPP